MSMAEPTPDATLALVRARLEAGAPGEALDLLRPLLATHPGHAAARFHQGVVLEALGRREAAAAAYRRTVELAPHVPAAHYNLGGVLDDLGAPGAAAQAYRRALELNPNLDKAHFNLGGALKAMGDLEGAAASYGRALEIAPGMVPALVNLGYILLELGRYDEAIAVLERAVAAAPSFAGAHANLGNALRAAERYDEAVATYRRALACDPGFAEAYTNMGAALRATGDVTGAIEAHRRAIELRPDSVEAHVNLGIALLDQGDHQAASEACEAYLRRDPGNARVLALKAVVLDEMGRRDEARVLVDFDRLIQPVQWDAPEGYDDLESFNQALAAHILDHPTLVFAPTSHATREGRHTGELLAEPKGPVAALERMIDEAVRDYIRAHPAQSDHPFLADPPARWHLTVWSVVMEAQGHQVPHIHPAWLSGVYYPRVPPVVSAGADRHAGWIEFGRPGVMIPATVEPEVRAYRPEEGLMVLFPSYFYHHTVPYEADEQRISIAFDVLRDD